MKILTDSTRKSKNIFLWRPTVILWTRYLTRIKDADAWDLHMKGHAHLAL